MTKKTATQKKVVGFKHKVALDPKVDQVAVVARKREWDLIKRRLISGAWVALLARKGMGKTTTLNWLRASCQEGSASASCFLLNMRSLDDTSTEAAVHSFAELLKSYAQRMTGEIHLPTRAGSYIEMAASGVETGTQLREFILTLAGHCGDDQLLLLLDDGDIAPPGARDIVFRVLRSVHEALETKGEPEGIGVVVCGAEEGPWLGLPTDPEGSPLSNVLSRVTLDTFEVQHAQCLVDSVTRDADIEIEKSAVQQAVRLSDGVPLTIQYLLDHVCEYARSKKELLVTSSVVRLVAEKLGIEVEHEMPAILDRLDGRMARIEAQLMILGQLIRERR